MVQCWVMFGVIVTHIFMSGMPCDIKLFSSNLIGDPKVTHFHGSRALAFDGVVGNAGRGGVVAVDWSRGLWVAKFVENEADDASFFSLTNNAPSSASAAETNLRMVEMMWMAPLSLIGMWSRGIRPKKK